MPDVISCKKIKQLRLEKGLSQEKMAKACKVSTSHISMIERGERVPSLKILSRIAKILTVPSGTLMNEDLSSDLAVLMERYDIQVILERLQGLIQDLHKKKASIGAADGN
jgi:transcriptional regulator with XRE-family HTH domain